MTSSFESSLNGLDVNYRDDKRRGLDVGVVPATLP